MASTKRRSRKRKTSAPKPPPERVIPRVPDDIRVLHLLGVDYFMQWERFDIGCSFFLPTTATPVQAREALKKAIRYFKLQVEIRSRCEYGRYGVRIWRID